MNKQQPQQEQPAATVIPMVHLRYPLINQSRLAATNAKGRPLSISSVSSGTSTSLDGSSYAAPLMRQLPPRRASSKLQPSPSSASSHSNTSSLFRDDGFEDDTASEHLSSTTSSNYHHRLSFQGNRSLSGRLSQHRRHHKCHASHHHHHHRLSRGGCDDADDEYQSCEEDFAAKSHTTASTCTSNLDNDCALSTTSSSVLNHHQEDNDDHHHHHDNSLVDCLPLDELSLAEAKKQYRKSLLLEHQQHQHLLHAQHNQNKIQALLVPPPLLPPNICQHQPFVGSNVNITNNNNINNVVPSAIIANTTTNTLATPGAGVGGCTSPNGKHPTSKCDDRTVNIIGHMPTKSPGYWDSNLSISQRVVTEIIETERTYVDDLEQIVTGYICYLRNVLKQQKHLQSQNNINEVASSNDSPPSSANSNNNNKGNKSIDFDDSKSMLVFDEEDQAESVTNEVLGEEDEEEADYEEDEDEHLAPNGKDILHDISKIQTRHNNCNNINNNCNSNNNAKEVTMTQNETIDGAIITAGHIKKLFSNLEDIYKFNKDLLFRLEECYLNPSSVAECFVENSSGFEVYTHYCTMYPQVVSTLTELMGNQPSAQLLKERQHELSQSLPLGAYLLKPVQRILKYHILFQSLIKHTTDDETVDDKDRQLIGEAFSVMTSIACHINAMKKRHEHAIRVQEVQGLLCGWNGPDLTTLGELILEDTFKLYSRPKSSRHLFLFDNVLLITKKRRDGTLCYKGHIACSNLMLIEKIEGQPLVFNTVPFDSPKALCAFQAKNLDKKRDWCLQMKEVIIKSFDDKIPIHVRDILMSLTNSNTTDCTSSRSENAKAMRVPNYLYERKKLHKKK